jgi:streptogramin lyase
MTEPGVPVFDAADAETYGWRAELDPEGNFWLRVIDGRGSIRFEPGTNITYDVSGEVRATAQITDLKAAVDPDGNVWLSDGLQVTGERATPTRNTHAIIFAPGGFLRFEDGQLLRQGIELVAGRA